MQLYLQQYLIAMYTRAKKQKKVQRLRDDEHFLSISEFFFKRIAIQSIFKYSMSFQFFFHM